MTLLSAPDRQRDKLVDGAVRVDHEVRTVVGRKDRSDCGRARSSFAFRVRATFTAYGGPTIEVYSPVTQQTYTMNCTAGPGAQETCRGGNNAVVTF